jgi:hypothetical protein
MREEVVMPYYKVQNFSGNIEKNHEKSEPG